MRLLLVALLIALSASAQASPASEAIDTMFEEQGGRVKFKEQFRNCRNDADCTKVLSVCRWRAVSKASSKEIQKLSALVESQCKWPPPQEKSPPVVCNQRLCEIPPDGAYY